MNYLMHPSFVDYDDHDRSARAAERYEIDRGLRSAEEQRRAERRTRRRRRARRYLRAVISRFA